MYVRVTSAPFAFPTELEIISDSDDTIGQVRIDSDGFPTVLWFTIGQTTEEKIHRILRRDGWLQTEAELVAARTADQSDDLDDITQS